MIVDAIEPPKHLLYFSPVSWASYSQRPHYFARHFLERSPAARVTWVEPYANRLPTLADLGGRPAEGGARAPDPRVTVVGVPAWPVEPLPGGASLNRALRWRGLPARLAAGMTATEGVIGVGRPSALALLALGGTPARLRFYDAMDDFPEFYGGLSRRSMRRREQEVVAAVDRVSASSDALVSKFARQGVAARLVRNAYDMETLPPWSPRREEGPVVFGYIGTVGRWFDWELVAALARAFPAAEVRIVGPVFSSPSRPVPANVRLLGPCPQSAAAGHLQGFSCGLIPFRVTPLTASVDPIKYYEYRAMGLPVLSTRFGQMASRTQADGVYTPEECGGLENAARAALAHRDRSEEVARFRAENDWRARLDAGSVFA